MVLIELESKKIETGVSQTGVAWTRYVIEGRAMDGPDTGRKLTFSTFQADDFAPKGFENLETQEVIGVDYEQKGKFRNIKRIVYQDSALPSNNWSIKNMQSDPVPFDPPPKGDKMKDVMHRAIESGYEVARDIFSVEEPSSETLIDASVRIGLSMFIEYHRSK